MDFLVEKAAQVAEASILCRAGLTSLKMLVDLVHLMAIVFPDLWLEKDAFDLEYSL